MQRDPRPILVPVDFSADSRAALDWARGLAERIAAPLLVLHVVHDPATAPGTYRLESPDQQLQEIEAVARESLARFVAEACAEDAELLVVSGTPATRILEVARSRDAQQIVMGSRGLTGLQHLLLGSKAQRVAQLAAMPVTIVKGQRGEV